MQITPMLDLTSILIQIPLVGAFIWFALKLNASHQRTIDKLIADGRVSSLSVMTDWRNYLSKRDEQWLQFLVDQRDSQNRTLDTFAQRLSDLSNVVSDLDQHIRSKQALE